MVWIKNYEDLQKDYFFLTLEHQLYFDEIITKHIKNWEINRLAMIDRMVLQMALCEFLFLRIYP